MKILKVLVGSLLILAAVFLAGGLLLPATSHVERSILIKRTPAQVFALVNSYQRFNEWSPWFKLDPSAAYTYSGPPTGVGASMSWASQKPEVGTGSQTLIESVPNRKTVALLDFGEHGKARATMEITPAAEGSAVKWSFDSIPSDNRFERLVGSWLGLFMEKFVGTDYEQGLAKLKALLESEPG